MIKAFVQNEAGSRTRNIHNEKTLEHLGSGELDAPYPYAYGFILDTTTADGDNLDCYIVTDRPLAGGAILECEAAGVLELLENGEPDHKVILVPRDDHSRDVQPAVDAIRAFIGRPRSRAGGPRFEVGQFLGRAAALSLIERARD